MGARLMCTIDKLGNARQPARRRRELPQCLGDTQPGIMHELIDPFWHGNGDLRLSAHFSIRFVDGKPDRRHGTRSRRHSSGIDRERWRRDAPGAVRALPRRPGGSELLEGVLCPSQPGVCLVSSERGRLEITTLLSGVGAADGCVG
jgi:hypothetical protein